MAFLDYQWRAGGGYQRSPPPPPVAQPVNLFYFPVPPVFLNQQLNCIQGPIPIHAVCAPPSNVHINGVPPSLHRAPLVIALPPPPALPKKKKGEKNHEGKKDEGPKKIAAAATPLRPGTNYMFPLEHTDIHIFNFPRKVWEKKYEGSEKGFKAYKVDTQKTVKGMIEFVMQHRVGGDFEKCKGWAATEVVEIGDSKWKKGTTIEYTSDKAKGTLASIGWNAKRGDSLPPVWVTVHKV